MNKPLSDAELFGTVRYALRSYEGGTHAAEVALDAIRARLEAAEARPVATATAANKQSASAKAALKRETKGNPPAALPIKKR